VPQWQPLPDTLHPDVRRLVEQLRLLKDRSGLSLLALAQATSCSKSAWQRYLNGTKFPPRAVAASLGRLAGADAPRLLALWDIAEPAWVPEAGAGEGAAPLSSPLPEAPARTPRRPPVRVFALAGVACVTAAGGLLAGPALWSALTAAPAAGHRTAQDAALDGLPRADCSGTSCQGRDPYASGCDRDAVTAGSVDLDSLTVQLRYSRRCGTAWTSTRGGALGTGLRSLSISGDNGNVLASLPVTGTASPADHSPMLATGDPGGVEACAVVDDVQACAGTQDPGGPPRVLTYLPADPN
jgi:transcriptional regulator with XRE-family HTH domain